MSLNNLRPPKGAKQSPTRVGRGKGSGLGKTAGRGHKGAQSRSGYKSKRGFEGGQMPLHRRVPKRGFHNPFRTEYVVINLDTLGAAFEAIANRFPESEFTAARLASACSDSYAGELRGAVDGAGCRDSRDARQVGYWLRANRDRRAGGRKLLAMAGARNARLWRLTGAGPNPHSSAEGF